MCLACFRACLTLPFFPPSHTCADTHTCAETRTRTHPVTNVGMLHVSSNTHTCFYAPQLLCFFACLVLFL